MMKRSVRELLSGPLMDEVTVSLRLRFIPGG